MNKTIDCTSENSKLFDFSLDTENVEKNYNLAKWYEEQGHTASAHTYYLRAAERSDDDLLAYAALLRASFCYKSQGSRPATEKILLENALNLLPNRPEAYYFLSLFYEKKSEWQNVYTYANLGLQCYRQEIESIDVPEYLGKYQLIFQKAVSAWWWGKGKECRELFWKLVDEYWEDLDQKYKDLVEKNISKIGAGPESQSASFYDHRKHSQLRYIFKGSGKIKNNYSQTFQDMFVLSMLNGKTSGTFLEIGGAKPFERNNTALLEKEFQWTGVSIDCNENFVEQYKKERPNVKVLFENALQIDFEKLLLECYQTKTIDYLQLDIEPARNTYECLLKIPFDDYKFAVITYEHDHYIDVTKSCRKKSREFLQNKGYVLVVNDISVDGISTFEDWWVHPDLVDPKILELMMSVSDKITNVTEYFHSKKKLNYYAEFETDKYIRENFFPDFNYSGIFVEVGAGPPEFISNSKHFRDIGWRTICVEPNPKFVKQHKEFGSEVYQYACSDQDGKSNFVINYNNDSWYSHENDGVSFSSLEIRYDGVPSHNTQEIIEVEKIKLNTLLEKINVEKIDVLSIDTEGWELDVMRGFDHLKYNPKVIVLENFENNKKYENFMQERGYSKKINLGYNEIYVKNSSQTSLNGNFNGKINHCDCYWCQQYPFPRLTLIGDKHWFEIPKNGSATIKALYPDYKHLDKSEYPKDVIPVVVFDDPVSRFISLINDYFCNGNRENNTLGSSQNSLYSKDIFESIGMDLDQVSDHEKVGIVLKNLDKITSRHQVHHFYPQTKFIDTESFDNFKIISKQEINSYFGTDKIFNKSPKGISIEDLTKEQIDTIREIYASDYEFYKKYYKPEVKNYEPVKVAEKFEYHATPLSFPLGQKTKRSAIIVDNFYENPDKVREFALKQDYHIGGIGRGYIGNRTHQQFLFPGLKEKFEEIIGQKITKWEEYGMNGRFQYCWSGQPLVYHCDSQKWGGMLYLTPGAPYQCGTTLYAHKQTRARTYYDEGWDAAWKDVPGDSHLDGTPFEPVDVLGNVYNRLVIFDASCIHSASEYFGTVQENARLWQMFFFDT